LNSKLLLNRSRCGSTGCEYGCQSTGWRRVIGCLKLQVIVGKRATDCRALLRTMTYKDKAFYDSTPPCSSRRCGSSRYRRSTGVVSALDYSSLRSRLQDVCLPQCLLLAATARPTQSIMLVPIQVNRLQKSILLVVQYKYLKSCSGDFYSPESDPPHKIMRYWFHYSI